MVVHESFRIFNVYRKDCKALANDLVEFGLTALTPDLKTTTQRIREHNHFTLKRVLQLKELFRLLIGKPSPTFIARLQESGKEYSILSLELGKSWHYPDNQMTRKRSNTFLEKERLYASIRDRLDTLSTLADYGTKISKYSDVQQHIISERGLKWLGYPLTFILGIVSGVSVGLIQDSIKNSKLPTTTKSYYYIAQSKPIPKDPPLKKVGCTESLATARGDARRCSSENRIYDPCFVEVAFNDIVTCPGDPRGDDVRARFVMEDYTPNHYEEKDPEPWFIITESGSKCGRTTGTTLFAADQSFSFGCNDGQEAYLLEPVNTKGNTAKYRCIKKTAENRIQECIIKELWR